MLILRGMFTPETPAALARPKAPKARAAPATPSPDARKRGRPPKGEGETRVRELPGITVRAEPDLLARLDAIVAWRNRRLAAEGASTSRGAVTTIALREFCDRAEAAARAAQGGTGAP